MTLEETLIKFGMTAKEAKIYLASLELGPATILEISKKAGVKRPTTYVLLDPMIERGYITKTSKNQKTLYSAQSPESLRRSTRSKEEALQESIPLLQAIMASAKDRPKVTVYEGKEGMAQVYAQIFDSSEISWFASMDEINRSFPWVPKKMLEISKKKQLSVRELLTSDSVDMEYAKEAMHNNPNYQVRLLPKGLPVHIDSAIFENKIAILAVKKDLFAIIIESKEVADSFRSLHALAWQSAIPLSSAT